MYHSAIPGGSTEMTEPSHSLQSGGGVSRPS